MSDPLAYLNQDFARPGEAGKVELATVEEVVLGLDDTKAVTPEGVAAAVQSISVDPASETVAGIAEIATQAEADAGTDDLRFVTPLKLANYPFPSASPASETVAGIAEIATQAEADAGTDDLRFVTPLKLANIPGLITPDATPTVKGKIEISTDAEAIAGVLGDKAVVPSNLPLVFDAPPALGTTVPNSATVTSLTSTGTTILASQGSSVVTIGNTNASSGMLVQAGAGGQIDIGIDANDHSVSIGSITGLSPLNLRSGTGGLNIGTDANAQSIVIGNNTVSTTLQLFGSNISGVSSSGVDLYSTTGPVEIGSTGTSVGTQRYSNSSSDHATIIGSTTGASPMTLNAGTSGMTFVGGQATESKVGVAEIATQAEADAGTDDTRYITPLKLANYPFPSGSSGPLPVTFTQSPILQSIETNGIAPTGLAGDVNIVMFQNGLMMEQYIVGTQTIICPRMNTNGLDVSLDQTSGDGCEFNFGTTAAAGHQYVIGTSSAFYVEATFRIEDVSGANPVGIGFRILSANNTSYFNGYTDQYFISTNSSQNEKFLSNRRLNSVGSTQVLTADWLDGETHKIKILVDGSGNCSCEIDDVDAGVAAFAFDTGDIVIPYVRIGHDADLAGEINWLTFDVGLQ